MSKYDDENNADSADHHRLGLLMNDGDSVKSAEFLKYQEYSETQMASFIQSNENLNNDFKGLQRSMVTLQRSQKALEMEQSRMAEDQADMKAAHGELQAQQRAENRENRKISVELRKQLKDVLDAQDVNNRSPPSFTGFRPNSRTASGPSKVKVKSYASPITSGFIEHIEDPSPSESVTQNIAFDISAQNSIIWEPLLSARSFPSPSYLSEQDNQHDVVEKPCDHDLYLNDSERRLEVNLATELGRCGLLIDPHSGEFMAGPLDNHTHGGFTSVSEVSPTWEDDEQDYSTINNISPSNFAPLLPQVSDNRGPVREYPLALFTGNSDAAKPEDTTRESEISCSLPSLPENFDDMSDKCDTCFDSEAGGKVVDDTDAQARFRGSHSENASQQDMDEEIINHDVLSFNPQDNVIGDSAFSLDEIEEHVEIESHGTTPSNGPGFPRIAESGRGAIFDARFIDALLPAEESPETYIGSFFGSNSDSNYSPETAFEAERASTHPANHNHEQEHTPGSINVNADRSPIVHTSRMCSYLAICGGGGSIRFSLVVIASTAFTLYYLKLDTVFASAWLICDYLVQCQPGETYFLVPSSSNVCGQSDERTSTVSEVADHAKNFGIRSLVSSIVCSLEISGNRWAKFLSVSSMVSLIYIIVVLSAASIACYSLLIITNWFQQTTSFLPPLSGADEFIQAMGLV